MHPKVNYYTHICTAMDVQQDVLIKYNTCGCIMYSWMLHPQTQPPPPSHWQDKEQHDELLTEQSQRAVILGVPSRTGAAACIVILVHSM